MKPETGPSSLKSKSNVKVKSLHANDVPRSSTTRLLGQEKARLHIGIIEYKSGNMDELQSTWDCYVSWGISCHAVAD